MVILFDHTMRPEQFLSDVGGAAGLVLGMSLATIIGVADCLIVSIYRIICRHWFTIFRKKPRVSRISQEKLEARNSYDAAMEIKDNPDLFSDHYPRFSSYNSNFWINENNKN